MDKMIVDPELFITCRLCLVQKGQYQIVPSVQKQIKFCFDIEVHPFDGLPQLICTDCEDILCNFNNIKEKFQERQLQLKFKIAPGSSEAKNVNSSLSQEHDVVTSTAQMEEQEDEVKSPYFKSVKRKQTISTDDKNEISIESDSCAPNHSEIKKKKRSPKHYKKWQADYDKFFLCQYCIHCFKNKKNISKHLKIHEALLTKYNLKNCSVPLPKVDGKANITGSQNALVLSQDRIIQNTKANFNVLFLRKTERLSRILVENTTASDSSGDNFVVKKKSKRNRFRSQSSNETVVLEGSSTHSASETVVTQSKNNDDQVVIASVDICDSAESDMEKKQPDISTKNNAKSRIISNTVTSCLNRYINKNNSSENYKNNKESLLIHKFLSIGTKIINKKEFSCTGLLRFLENKNLNVSWTPRSTKITQCVRIVTKLKEPIAPDNDSGWKRISTLAEDNEIPFHDLLDKLYEYEASSSMCKVSPKKSPCRENVESNIATLDQAVISVHNENESQLKVLLNTNPVPNPKRLPKKPLSSQNCKVTSENGTRGAEPNMVMPLPIITQSVSLAGPPEEAAVVESTSALPGSSTNTSYQPRIKVKSASQLMARTTSDISLSPLLNWNTPVSTSGIPDTTNSMLNGTVIMHTSELPNMKTTSPFLYCKNLLQIHNIVLLDSNDLILPNYSCLIKFKSIFNQDNQQSVTLGLGLFSDSNNFAMKLKDMHKLIDISSLLPRWQWEVIQLFRGDEITAKLRENAMSIGQEMFKRTNYFISVLKCIVFRDYV